MLIVLAHSETRVQSFHSALNTSLKRCSFRAKRRRRMLNSSQVLPLAHFSVRPIRRLRDATEKSVAPPGFSPSRGSLGSEREDELFADETADTENGNTRSTHSKKGFFVRLRNLNR